MPLNLDYVARFDGRAIPGSRGGAPDCLQGMKGNYDVE